MCSTAAVAVGAQEVMGLRDSSKFNTAHQAGVRDPDRPSPTSITSFFDYHVISFIQALHERHLRHRPCPDTTTCMLTTAKTQDLAFRRGGPGLTPSTTQCAGFRSIPWIHLPRQDSKSLRAHRRLRPAQGSLHALLWRFLQLQVPFPRFSYRHLHLYGHNPATSHRLHPLRSPPLCLLVPVRAF